MICKNVIKSIIIAVAVILQTTIGMVFAAIHAIGCIETR